MYAMFSHMIRLTYISPGIPYIPTVQIDATTTTANISWRLPTVGQNDENYTLVYPHAAIISQGKAIVQPD